MMLKFDRILITQAASKIEAGKTVTFEPIWIQRLDAPVLDALHRLISLLDEAMLIPQLAPLIQQKSSFACCRVRSRLTCAPRQCRWSDTTDCSSGDMDQVAFHRRDASGRSGRMRQHESDHVPAAFSDDHRNEPRAVSEAASFAGGAATHARSKHERWECNRPRWLRKCVAV